MNIAFSHSLNWDHIRFFLAVANNGSLAGAARDLGVNHSTVFRRINSFESDIGTRLFERLPEGYALTAAGEEILVHARKAEEAMAALSRSGAARDFQLRGEIRLTTAQSLASEFVSPALVQFKKEFPGIRVNVAVSDSDFDLSRREADLALRATSSPPEHLVGRHIASLPWFVFASTNGSQPRNMAQMGDFPLIGADAPLDQLPAFRWLANNFNREQVVASANSLNTMSAMAKNGLGLAVLPADQNQTGLKQLFPLDPHFTTELWLLSHPDLRHVARNKAFSDFLVEYLKKDKRIKQYF